MARSSYYAGGGAEGRWAMMRGVHQNHLIKCLTVTIANGIWCIAKKTIRKTIVPASCMKVAGEADATAVFYISRGGG